MTLARNKKKPTKKQIIRKKKLESDKRFRKFLINGVVISAICMFLFYAFVVKRCDTLLLISSYMLYGKQIDPECICHAENRLKEHKTSVLKYSKNTFYVCGSGCCHRIEKHYQKYAFTIDAVSGDSILKSNAIIGWRIQAANATSTSPKLSIKNSRGEEKSYFFLGRELSMF